jgi:hypothetical protein
MVRGLVDVNVNVSVYCTVVSLSVGQLLLM